MKMHLQNPQFFFGFAILQMHFQNPKFKMHFFFPGNFDYKKEVIFIKKNIIVINPSKIDVKQKDTAKSLCYDTWVSFRHALGRYSHHIALFCSF